MDMVWEMDSVLAMGMLVRAIRMSVLAKGMLVLAIVELMVVVQECQVDLMEAVQLGTL